MSKLKIEYEDIAVGAKEDSSFSSTDKKQVVDLFDLKKDITFPNYALCLPRYSRLDGTYVNAPGAISNIGYISNSISSSTGEFTTDPMLEITFTEKYISVGITLKFNDYSGDYCNLVNIKWYNDLVLIQDKDFEPDSSNYFCSQAVEYYNKIVITFNKTSKPFRYAFLTRIDFGLIRNFRSDEAKNVSCVQEISPISEVLSINALNFTIRSKSDIAFIFQKKQKMNLFFDDKLLGVFYVAKGKRTSSTDYAVDATDCVGILDGLTYYGGIFDGVTFESLVQEIMSDTDIEYIIENVLKTKLIYGYLPILSKRDAIAQACFAVGAIFDTSNNEKVNIVPLQTAVTKAIDKSQIFAGSLSIETSDIVTGADVTVHKYSLSEEVAELYNDTLNGTALITLSEPHHALCITGGTIDDSGANYAVITGNGAVLLSGKKYNHGQSVISMRNPNISKHTNIIKAKNATLVASNNANDVLNRVYNYYINNEIINARIVLDNIEPGQRTSIYTYNGDKIGTVEKLNLKFTNEIIAEVVVK
jgi:hypothetical protein